VLSFVPPQLPSPFPVPTPFFFEFPILPPDDVHTLVSLALSVPLPRVHVAQFQHDDVLPKIKNRIFILFMLSNYLSSKYLPAPIKLCLPFIEIISSLVFKSFKMTPTAASFLWRWSIRIILSKDR